MMFIIREWNKLVIVQTDERALYVTVVCGVMDLGVISRTDMFATSLGWLNLNHSRVTPFIEKKLHDRQSARRKFDIATHGVY